MAKVSKDMLIGQLLQVDANIAPILMRAGMTYTQGLDEIVGILLDGVAVKEGN